MRAAHAWQAASPAWEYIHTHFGFGYRFEPHQLR